MKNRTKTISLLLAVCMMITLLPAVALAAGEWIADTNGSGMKYRYYDGNFDIHGTFDGKEKSTTFSDYGYWTYIRTGGSDYRVTAKPSSEMFTVGGTGLQVGIDLSFGGDVQNAYNAYVNITYTVKNISDARITFALGSGADIKIGSDDSAVITPLDTCDGFKMVSDSDSDSRTDSNGEKEYAQFNFFGSGTGLTDISSYWYGSYSSGSYYWIGRENKAIFEYGAAESSSGNFDSAATWRWADQTIDAGETKTYTVAVGIGGKGSEEAVVDEAVISGDIFGTCTNLDVKLVNLNGNVYEGPAVTVTQDTNDLSKWHYSAQVIRGRYNVVATATDNEGKTITVTKLVTINKDTTENLNLPTAQKSSKVENNASAFNALAGGVDSIAAAQNETVPVTITLKVSDVAEDGNAEAAAIKAQTGDKVVDFVDLSLFKQIGSNTPVDIGDANNTLLTIMLKYDTNRRNIRVFRHHGYVEELNSINENDQREGFWIGNGYIGIRANKFSTYAVAYDSPSPGGAPGTVDPGTSSGISLWYNGGNSFGSSNSAVPTSVEIDGVPVSFNGNGREFTVGCISPNAKWVTVNWNSTSVTTNFTPDANATCAEIILPKTGDVSVMAFALMAVVAAAGAMGKK